MGVGEAFIVGVEVAIAVAVATVAAAVGVAVGVVAGGCVQPNNKIAEIKNNEQNNEIILIYFTSVISQLVNRSH